MQEILDEAVEKARTAYDKAEKNPLNHGFAHVTGIDGRTTLAREMKEHPDIDVGHDTRVTIDGVSRYLTPQRTAYRRFIETLEDNGVDTQDARVSGRLD